MRQTFLGFGAKLADVLSGGSKEGVRTVVIERFAPMNSTDVSWQISTKVEAASSIKARDQARAAKKPEPEPVMVDQTTEGNLEGINLKDAYSLYLPAYWPAKEHAPSFGTSAIWLSDQAFQSLSRNRVASLNFGILDPSLMSSVQTKEIKDALSKLKVQVTQLQHVDVVELKGDKDLISWPLKVNGKDIEVEAIKAHSWFGEIVVLNNPQNPLILKATLNPLAAGTGGIVSGLSLLQSFVGYEVTALDEVQE